MGNGKKYIIVEVSLVRKVGQRRVQTQTQFEPRYFPLRPYTKTPYCRFCWRRELLSYDKNCVRKCRICETLENLWKPSQICSKVGKVSTDFSQKHRSKKFFEFHQKSKSRSYLLIAASRNLHNHITLNQGYMTQC